MKSNNFAFQGIISLLYDISPLVVHLLYLFFLDKKNTISYILLPFGIIKWKSKNTTLSEQSEIKYQNRRKRQTRYSYHTNTDRSISCLGSCTSMKSGGIKLDSWAQNIPSYWLLCNWCSLWKNNHIKYDHFLRRSIW